MKCVICGKQSDGLLVCRECMQEAAETPQERRRIEQTANVLTIAEESTESLKRGIESILEIGYSLEVFGNGEKEKNTS